MKTIDGAEVHWKDIVYHYMTCEPHEIQGWEEHIIPGCYYSTRALALRDRIDRNKREIVMHEKNIDGLRELIQAINEETAKFEAELASPKEHPALCPE